MVKQKYYNWMVIFNTLDIKYYRKATDIVRELGIPRPTIYWRLKNPDAPKQTHTHITIERCKLPIIKEKITVNHEYPQTVFDEVAV